MEAFIWAFVWSAVFTAILSAWIRHEREPLMLVASFVLLMLATWAIGIWFVPFTSGYAWLWFFGIAAFIGLLVTAVTPEGDTGRKRRLRDDTANTAAGTVMRRKDMGAPALIAGLGLFFWVFMVVAIFAIASGYWWIDPSGLAE